MAGVGPHRYFLPIPMLSSICAASRGPRRLLLCLATGLLPATSCGTGDGDLPPPAREATDPLFTEITAQVGFDADPPLLPDGTYELPEIMGNGVALFDADGDGDLDLLQVRTPIPAAEGTARSRPRLYLQGEDGRFVDATEGSGLGEGFGQGVAVGDVEGDGDLDLFLANLGVDALYLNRGDGTFVDATARAGIEEDAWSVSATFLDYDGDHDLDLFVVHYGRYEPGRGCTAMDGSPDYCSPLAYEGTVDALYRNEGDGIFTNVTAEAGIEIPGRGLGAVAAELTGDDRIDVYVANDDEANRLWANRGDGTFADEAMMRGAAFNAMGEAEASMGVDVGDVDGDGRLDLFMTHLTRQTNTLYMATEAGLFRDRSVESGLGPVDRPYTGFGTGFVDFDHDGDLDLAVVNGAVVKERVWPGAELGEFWNLLAQPNLLFRNEGAGRFVDVSTLAESFASRVEVSRGLAFGDLDGDGDLDMVVANLRGIRVYRNDAPDPEAHWLAVRTMVGRRDAVGSEVTVAAGGREWLRLASPGFGYASSNDPRAHFGLGRVDRVDRLEVRWPDGLRESFPAPAVNRVVTVRRGEGERLP